MSRLVDILESFQDKKLVIEGGVQDDWDRVLPLINRESASEVGKSGLLPLHLASRSEVPLKIINALLAAFPEAAARDSKGGHLPIHLAALNRTSLDCVLAILDAFPNGSMVQDSMKFLPLHMAVLRNNSVQVIAAL